MPQVQGLGAPAHLRPSHAHLAVRAGLDDLPRLEVHVIAVQFVGQCIVRGTPKHIEVAVKGHHGVPVAPLWGRRGATEQVLCGDARPPRAQDSESVPGCGGEGGQQASWRALILPHGAPGCLGRQGLPTPILGCCWSQSLDSFPSASAAPRAEVWRLALAWSPHLCPPDTPLSASPGQHPHP